MTYLTLRALPIVLMGGAIACSSPLAPFYSPESSGSLPSSLPPEEDSSTPSSSAVYQDFTMMTLPSSPERYPIIQDMTLIAREAAIPTIGEANTPDRPIGFASVFLTIENPVNAEQSLVLETVEVVSVETREVFFTQPEPQTITLMPLENMELDVQLQNQRGYPATEQVRAIATYYITHHSSTDDDILGPYRIDSPVVEVERSP